MSKIIEADADNFAPAADNPAPYGYKKDGTPKGAPGRPKINVKPTVPDESHAGPPLRRNNPRQFPREQTREMAREPSREQSTITGRNGEELKRTRQNAAGDIFDRVRPPAGWSYQWNAISHYNKEVEELQKSISVDMYENGWRPVLASRHPGVYTPPGFEGAIIVKGQRLEERPMAMTQQAMAEDVAYAKSQLRAQTDLLSKKQADLPGANAGRARQVSGIRMEIDKSFDLPPDENYEVEG